MYGYTNEELWEDFRIDFAQFTKQVFQLLMSEDQKQVLGTYLQEHRVFIQKGKGIGWAKGLVDAIP